MAQKTYRDLITSALRLLGVKGQGQTMSGNEAETGLDVLNEILDSWNSYSGLLFQTQSDIIPLTGASFYPLGNMTGTNPQRPSELLGAWFRNTSNYDLPLEVLANSDFANIGQKDLIGAYPRVVYLDVGATTSLLRIYPVGASVGSLVVQYIAPLSGVGLDTPEVLPPAYRQALRYNLACNLAAEYGKEVSPAIMTTAMTSKAMIINANATVPLMDFTSIFDRFNINTGV
jgi:hypothetical protein